MKFIKKLIFVVVVIVCVSLHAHSQTPVDSVKITIDKLFSAMKNSDGASLKECFTDSAILQTIARDKTGTTVVKNEKLTDFISLIASMPKETADERISYDVVKTDGALAIAWTPYKFYLSGKFSHCGVNSFQLVRLNGIWKIQYLIDTRRKQPCE